MPRCMRRRRVTTLIVVLTVAPVLLAAPVAEAAFAPSVVRGASGTPLDRTADLAILRFNLERRLVQQRLVDLGVDPTEASARLDQLGNEEMHAAAEQMRALVPGGDGLGLVVGAEHRKRSRRSSARWPQSRPGRRNSKSRCWSISRKRVGRRPNGRHSVARRAAGCTTSFGNDTR